MDQKTIMLFDTGTGQWKELAATSAADPVWSSDSKALYVHAFLAPQQPILRIKVPSGELHPVASLANFGVGAAADYFFGGLTPENAPLVRPRVGTGNLYSLDLSR